jgi:hypothetical protein
MEMAGRGFQPGHFAIPAIKAPAPLFATAPLYNGTALQRLGAFLPAPLSASRGVDRTILAKQSFSGSGSPFRPE